MARMSEEDQIALALALSVEDQGGSSNNSSKNNNNSNSNNKPDVRKRRIPFDENYYIRQFKDGFSKLYHERVGTDTVLHITPSDTKIFCHSLVLGVWSDTFRALLKGNLNDQV